MSDITVKDILWVPDIKVGISRPDGTIAYVPMVIQADGTLKALLPDAKDDIR